jgi:hypothetical protein
MAVDVECVRNFGVTAWILLTGESTFRATRDFKELDAVHDRRPPSHAPAQRAIAQRFRALALTDRTGMSALTVAIEGNAEVRRETGKE